MQDTGMYYVSDRLRIYQYAENECLYSVTLSRYFVSEMSRVIIVGHIDSFYLFLNYYHLCSGKTCKPHILLVTNLFPISIIINLLSSNLCPVSILRKVYM